MGRQRSWSVGGSTAWPEEGSRVSTKAHASPHTHACTNTVGYRCPQPQPPSVVSAGSSMEGGAEDRDATPVLKGPFVRPHNAGHSQEGSSGSKQSCPRPAPAQCNCEHVTPLPPEAPPCRPAPRPGGEQSLLLPSCSAAPPECCRSQKLPKCPSASGNGPQH